MQNFWFIFPLLSSFFVAWLTIIVQNNKQIPPVLIFAGKSIILGILLLPALFFVDIPKDPFFYVAILIIAIGNSIAGTIVYSANHRFGGGLTTRILPLTTIITIFAFFIIFPETAEQVSQSGSLGLLFIASIFVMCASVYFMSKAETNLKAVLFILPSCFIYAFSNIIQKLMIDEISLAAALVTFLCFANLAQGAIALTFSKLRTKKKKVIKATFKFKKRYLLPLVGVALCSLSSAMLGLVAFKIMTNPGVALLIARAAPIWVYIYNVHTGEEKLDSKVIPSFIFLGFATMTILLYNIILKG